MSNYNSYNCANNNYRMEANTSPPSSKMEPDADTFKAVEQALYAILERRGMADLKGAEDTFL